LAGRLVGWSVHGGAAGSFVLVIAWRAIANRIGLVAIL
jgi:heme O synthase-like polyprenyltransferase